MPLSDLEIRKLKPEARPKKHADGGGLYLEVMPSGSKIWRYAYRPNGAKSPRPYTIGHYPEISLAEARRLHREAVEIVKAGKDPVKVRQQERIAQQYENANTFQALADEWLLKNQGNWTERHYQKVQSGLTRHVYPIIGSIPVRELTAAQVYRVLQTMEKGKIHTMAVIARQWISAVCCFAVVTGRADNDPAAPLRRAIQAPPVNHARPMLEKDIQTFLERLSRYQGADLTILAFRLMLYTFVRTKELRTAEWTHFDLDGAVWTIPAELMKMRRKHLIPLSRQALGVLEQIRERTGHGKFLFPSIRTPGGVMSHATLNRALEYMGYPKGDTTAHDFRATASTHLNEMGYNPDAIERQLAHVEKSSSRKPYNHAEYLREREKMMQDWADWVDSLNP